MRQAVSTCSQLLYMIALRIRMLSSLPCQDLPRLPNRSLSTATDPYQHIRYKAFLDKWWRKKSLVDTIFVCGHWSRDISNTYLQDLAEPPLPLPAPPPDDNADAVVSRVGALKARRQHRYARSRMHRFMKSSVEKGVCSSCGWHTDWEPEDLRLRVQCIFCSRLVCRRWCCVPDFLVCKTCHPIDAPPGPAVMPQTVPDTATAEACFSCGRATHELSQLAASSAASSADSRAGRQTLRKCVRCNRWLCVDCRQTQAPTVCMVCPALHTVELPSLRQVRSGPSAQTVQQLKEAADAATSSRGRGRLSSGQYLHQHHIDGRAQRVAHAAGKRARLDE